LRPKHWLELLKDYDLWIQYHLGKANAVVDALSRNTQRYLNTLVIMKLNYLRELEDLGIQLVSHGQASVQLSALIFQPSIIEKIQMTQESDIEL